MQLWCVTGDFNSIRTTEERVSLDRSNMLRGEMNQFNEFISQMEVVDIPLIGRAYTWYKPNGRVKSRLDRFLVSRDWLLQWPGSIQITLKRSISNHCPVKLQSSLVDWGPKPFRSLDC